LNPECMKIIMKGLMQYSKRINKSTEIQKHKDKLSDSASLVLDYLITGETEKELFVKDERDEVFKRLLEGLKK
ncbi:MAG: hypothetical protein ACE5J9_07440, partial [Methanosarcinales archaeon]